MVGEHRRAAIAVTVAWHVVLLATPHVADGGARRCFTPAAENALRTLLTTGALNTSLAPSLTFSGVNVSVDEIVLRAEDTRRQQHAVTLSLDSLTNRQADGRGKQFAYYLTAPLPTDPRVRQALLSSSDLIDRAVPAAALVDCSPDEDHAPPDAPAQRQPDHVTRAVALSSAVMQILVLVLATVFGWRAITAHADRERDF